ncbi:MAG: metallophosphoesterase [Opitutaceae bacterium]|nr:metallophosphoesterase [Opitutaceae bacterium]
MLSPRLIFTAALLLLLPILVLRAESLRARFIEVDSAPLNLMGLWQLLREAGFEVEVLPLDRSPAEIATDLIVIGSFANRDSAAQEYLRTHAAALRGFVEKGGVLLQLAQQVEPQRSPAFLPASVHAARGDAILGDLQVMHPEHALLQGLAQDNSAGRVHLPPHLGLKPSWHTFMQHWECAVLLGAGGGSDDPAMLEAAHGRGRFLMASLFIDRLYGPGDALVAPQEYHDFATRFMRNLAGYVRDVRSGHAPAVRISPKPQPRSFVPGSWTIAVLPDTQYYSRSHPDVFEAQTRWLAEQAEALDIRYVLHLGDITHGNTPEQWEVAQRAMARLHGVVPYAIVGGNHDYGPAGNSANRDSLFNDYFPVSRYEALPTFGGVMEPGRIDNSYHLFEAGGRKWIVLALEWAPRDAAVTWADRVLRQHSDRLAIIITHAYMFADDTRYHWVRYGRARQPASPRHYGVARLPEGANDGEDLWEKLVSRHPGIFMVINGHTPGDGVARLTSTGVHGNAVHQMLVNYQRMPPRGGNGYLRLYEFQPDGETVQVRSYSPLLDRYSTDVQNQYAIKLPPLGTK